MFGVFITMLLIWLLVKVFRITFSLAWGFLKITALIMGIVAAVLLLVGITLWAKLGNLLLEHNWFFLNEDVFYIGLVEGGIIPKWSLMIINPVAVFLVVLVIYGICALVRNKSKKAVSV